MNKNFLRFISGILALLMLIPFGNIPVFANEIDVGYLYIDSTRTTSALPVQTIVKNNKVYVNISDLTKAYGGELNVQYIKGNNILSISGAGERIITYNFDKQKWGIANDLSNAFLMTLDITMSKPILLKEFDYKNAYVPLFPLIHYLGINTTMHDVGITFYVPNVTTKELIDLSMEIMEPFGEMEVNYYKEGESGLSNAGKATERFLSSAGDILFNGKFGQILTYEARLSEDVISGALGGVPTYVESELDKKWSNVDYFMKIRGAETFKEDSDFVTTFFTPGSFPDDYIVETQKIYSSNPVKAAKIGAETFVRYQELAARTADISLENISLGKNILIDGSKYLELDFIDIPKNAKPFERQNIVKEYEKTMDSKEENLEKEIKELDTKYQEKSISYSEYSKQKKSIEEELKKHREFLKNEYQEQKMAINLWEQKEIVYTAAQVIYNQYINGVDMGALSAEVLLDTLIEESIDKAIPGTVKEFKDLFDIMIEFPKRDVDFMGDNIKKEHYDLQRYIANTAYGCIEKEEDYKTQIYHLYNSAKLYINTKASYMAYKKEDLKKLESGKLGELNNSLARIHPGEALISIPKTASDLSNVNYFTQSKLLDLITYEKPILSLRDLEYGMFLLSIKAYNDVNKAILNDLDKDGKLEMLLEYIPHYPEDSAPISVILDENKFAFGDNSLILPGDKSEFVYHSKLDQILIKVDGSDNLSQRIKYLEYDGKAWRVYGELLKENNKFVEAKIENGFVSDIEWNDFEKMIDKTYLEKIEWDKICTVNLTGEYDKLKSNIYDLLPDGYVYTFGGDGEIVHTSGDIWEDGIVDDIYLTNYDEYAVFSYDKRVPRGDEYVQGDSFGYIFLMTPTANGASISVMDDNLVGFNIYALKDMYVEDGRLKYHLVIDDPYDIPVEAEDYEDYDIVTNKEGLKELQLKKFEPIRMEFTGEELEYVKSWNAHVEWPDGTYRASLQFKDGKCYTTYLDWSQDGSRLVDWHGEYEVEYLYTESLDGMEYTSYFRTKANPYYPVGPSDTWYTYKVTGVHDRWIESEDGEITFTMSNSPVSVT